MLKLTTNSLESEESRGRFQECFQGAGQCQQDMEAHFTFTSPHPKQCPIHEHVQCAGEGNRRQHQTLVINSALLIVHLRH